MSQFSDLISEAMVVIDEHLGERVRVVPMKSSQYSGGIADPDRDPFELVGQLGGPTASDINLAGNRNNTWDARVGIGETMFAVDPVRFPASLTAQKGDRAEVIDAHRVGVTYQIVRVDRGQKSRLIFDLNTI